MKKLKPKKNGDAQKKRSGREVRESVLRLEGGLWRERFSKEIGLEAGMKERGRYGL